MSRHSYSCHDTELERTLPWPKTNNSLFLAFPALSRDQDSPIVTQTCNSLFFSISCTSNSIPMHLIQYYCLYTYYTGSIKFGKTFQHNNERVKISFYYKTFHLLIQNWINYPEFYELHNKEKIWPSSQLRPQMCSPSGVPPTPVNVFPRLGEQCLVE